MKKYTFTEISAETADFSFYFDGDGFTENAGGFEYNLFVIAYDRGRGYGFNYDRYKKIINDIENILDDPDETDDEKIKTWAADKCRADIETAAEYLTMTTGKKWNVAAARGYCQGDYCDVLYCEDIYSAETVNAAGEIFLGCGKEFKFNDGENVEVYGFIVADCQYQNETDLKKLLCEWEGIPENETTINLITGYYTITTCDYKTV